MKSIIIKTEKDTQVFAIKLAKSLKGGEIIALEGDLGAGKTTMTQYIAKSFGVKENVTSPTFVLMKIYEVLPSLKLRLASQRGEQAGRSMKSEVRKLVHVDCYRLDDPQELFYLGIEEYMNHKESVVVIEWADKIRDYLEKFKKVIWIKIKLEKDLRKMSVTKFEF